MSKAVKLILSDLT